MKTNKAVRGFIALAAVVCLLICTIGVSAAGSASGGSPFGQIDLPDINPENGFTSISGALTEEAVKGVTLMVFVPGTNTNSVLQSPAALAEKLYYTDTVYSKADGTFIFEFDMTQGPGGTEGATGTYPFILACGGIYAEELEYVNRNDVLNILRTVIAAKDPETLQTIFTKAVAAALGVNSSLADDAQKNLKGAAAAAVYGAIVNADPAIDGDDLASTVRIARLFEQPAALALLQSTTDAAKMQGFVEKYNKYYGFAVGEGNAYAEIRLPANRGIVYQALAAEGNLTTLAAARTSFEKAALIGYVNDISASGTMQMVLRKNAAMFGIDFAAYDALSSDIKRMRVMSDLMKLTMASGTEIAAQFAAKVQEQAAAADDPGSIITTTPPQSSNNRGSGGGGGGSWTGMPTAPGIGMSAGTGTSAENTQVFHDLGGAQWAEEPILALYNRGVINGKDSGVFEPESNVTRAEFVKMIVKALGLTATENTAAFADVTQDDWFYDTVHIAAAYGIVSGDGAGFRPNASITREDMAVIIVRAAQHAGIRLEDSDGAGFTDTAAISSYAVEAVAKMQASGIVNGMEDGSFQPQQNATRAQACKMLYELLKK